VDGTSIDRAELEPIGSAVPAMKPLGKGADVYLARLPSLTATHSHDSLSAIVSDALGASGLRAQRDARKRFDFDFASGGPGSITDLAIEVKTRVGSVTDLRRLSEGMAVDLRYDEEIERLLLLYGEGPRSADLLLDFDPGPLRFRRMDEFITRLRDDDPLEVFATIDREGHQHRPVPGRVVEIRDAGQAVKAVRPLADDAEAVRLEVGTEPSSDLDVGEHLLFEYQLPFAANDASVTAAAIARPKQPQPHSKTIGTWVEGDQEPVSGPLELEREYIMRFKVGDPESTSLLDGEEAEVPLSDIPEQGLETTWTVYAEGLSFAPRPPVESIGVAGNPTDTISFELQIPREGDSNIVDVPFTAATTGKVAVHIEIRAFDRIYRRLEAELEIFGTEPPEVPSAMAIRSDKTFISADSIAKLSPRPPYSIDIRVFDSKRAFVTASLPGGVEVNRAVDWNINANELDDQQSRVRAAAEDLREHHDSYLNDIAAEKLGPTLKSFRTNDDWSNLPDLSDKAHKQAWERVGGSKELRELAEAGHMLFDTVFPTTNALRGWLEKLPLGSRVTLNWDGSPADVPWGLFYRPPVGAGAQINPMGFFALGFRLVDFAFPPETEAFTYLGEPEVARTAACLFWGTEKPISEEAKWQEGEIGGPSVVWKPPRRVAEPRRVLLEYLEDKTKDGPAVLYFYCQHGKVRSADEGFRFGDNNEEKDTLTALALGASEAAGAPLVFANACETGAKNAYHASQIKRHFLRHDSWAYIGTETKVPPVLASRFATVFFRIFRGGDLTASEALSQTRLFFWSHYRNLGGLYYSYANEPALQLRAKATATE
jgi:hypothetical protein